MFTRKQLFSVLGRLMPVVAIVFFFVPPFSARESAGQERASIDFTVPTCNHAMAMSPDGRHVAIGGCLGFGVVDVDKRKVRLAVGRKEAPAVGLLALAPNGRHVAALLRRENCVKIWDLNMQHLRATFPLKHYAAGLAFSPDGNTIAVVSDKVRIWYLKTPGEPKIVDPYAGDLDAVTFSPDGKWLAIACSEKNGLLQDCILLWDLEKHRTTRQIDLAGPAHYLAFSPDGKWLAGVGKTVIVWNASDGKVRVQLQHAARCAALSPDGTLLATADEETMHLWDASTGKAIASFNTHKGDREIGVYCLGVAFTADGTAVVTSGRDDKIKIWDIPKRAK